MPTPIPSQEKIDFINIIKVGYPLDAAIIEPKLINYEDIIFALKQQLDIFAGNNNYLNQAIDVFTDAALIAVDIYVNKTETTLTNPSVLINTACNTGVNITTQKNTLLVIGTSLIVTLTLAENSSIQSLYVGPNSEVTLIDGTNANCIINLMSVKFLRSMGGTVGNALIPTVIAQIIVDLNATWGGFVAINPLVGCSDPVTAIDTDATSSSSITVTWTLPVDYLFVNIYFKLATDTNYITITNTNYGNYIGDTGFVFTNLLPATTYDFQTTITCINGGVSTPLGAPGTTL